MEIRLRKGFHIKNDAETVYRELETVRAENDGTIPLQDVVDRSKPKAAPLHDEFEWNNPKAANKWRLEQARKVVRSVEVIHAEAPTTRAYESVQVVALEETEDLEAPAEKKVFRHVDDIMSDPLARADLLSQAIRDAVAWRRRYSNLQELAKVFAALDEVAMSAEV